MITCGFFNAVNGDRTYNAEQMNNPYKRLISNGVFASPSGSQSNDLKVTANGTMIVSVNAGDGIFNGKWANNDAPYDITIDNADVSYPRIDTVVFRVDYGNRIGSIVLIKGTASNNPTIPEITRNETVFDYRLANIRVNANTESILQSNITDTRAGAECGFITHLLYQSDISSTFDQWQAQFDEWFANVKEELSTTTLIRSYSSRYTTTESETQIPIQISQFNKDLDILQVYINGLIQTPSTYTVNNNSQITLNEAIESGSNVDFVVYKSVDGSEAETVVSQVYQLQQLQLTNNSGGAKRTLFSGDLLTTFKNLGLGVHTILASDQVTNTPVAGQYFRCIGHITDLPYGWIIAISGDGKAYINFATGNTSWSGWREMSNSFLSPNGGVEISVTGTDNVLTKFANAGTGFHTMYAAYNTTGVPVVGAYRLLGHLTASGYGWLMAIKADASIWINYLDNGTWQGWKTLYSTDNNLFYSEDGTFPNPNAEIIPSKTLSECSHGWQLVFCGYDDTAKVARDVYVQTYCIPKRSHKNANWNGETISIPLIYQYVSGSDSSLMCQKTLTIYNNRIVGGSTASTGVQRNMVLKAIYEY